MSQNPSEQIGTRATSRPTRPPPSSSQSSPHPRNAPSKPPPRIPNNDLSVQNQLETDATGSVDDVSNLNSSRQTPSKPNEHPSEQEHNNNNPTVQRKDTKEVLKSTLASRPAPPMASPNVLPIAPTNTPITDSLSTDSTNQNSGGSKSMETTSSVNNRSKPLSHPPPVPSVAPPARPSHPPSSSLLSTNSQTSLPPKSTPPATPRKDSIALSPRSEHAPEHNQEADEVLEDLLEIGTIDLTLDDAAEPNHIKTTENSQTDRIATEIEQTVPNVPPKANKILQKTSATQLPTNLRGISSNQLNNTQAHSSGSSSPRVPPPVPKKYVSRSESNTPRDSEDSKTDSSLSPRNFEESKIISPRDTEDSKTRAIETSLTPLPEDYIWHSNQKLPDGTIVNNLAALSRSTPQMQNRHATEPRPPPRGATEGHSRTYSRPTQPAPPRPTDDSSIQLQSSSSADSLQNNSKSINRSFTINNNSMAFTTAGRRAPGNLEPNDELKHNQSSPSLSYRRVSTVSNSSSTPELPEVPQDTPEVLKNRGKLVEEILNTEKVFLEDLRLTIEKFLKPLRSSPKIIAPTNFAKLFLNIESLELISEEAANAFNIQVLQCSSSHEVQLAPVYLSLTDTLLQGFSLYCAGHSDSLLLLSRLKRKQSNFAAFLLHLEADETLNRKKLADMLTRPIQHICRQPLLIRELLKSTPKSHPDHEPLIEALAKINHIVERVNSHAKEVGNIQSLLHVENRVSELPEGLKLLMPGRYIVKEGRFLRTNSKNTAISVELYLFLFNDMVIITKPKSFASGDSLYTFIELLPLNTLLVENVPDNAEAKNLISLTSITTMRNYLLVSKDEKKNNELIKKEWMNAIANNKAEFEKGFLLQEEDLSEEGIGFKIKSGELEDKYNNSHLLRRDQLASLVVQERISGWKGEAILDSLNTPTATNYNFIKFLAEAPVALRIFGEDSTETIENDGYVFIFDDFVVLASLKKELNTKKPFEWIDSAIFVSSVVTNSEQTITDKKIQGGKSLYPLSLIYAGSRKKFVLYFRSEAVKTSMYNILSKKMPAFVDNGSVLGMSTVQHKRDKSAPSEEDNSKSTLRTKKNIFGKKLGYRTSSVSTTSLNGAEAGSGTSNAPNETSDPTSRDSIGRSVSSSLSLSTATKLGLQPTPFLSVLPQKQSNESLHTLEKSPSFGSKDDDDQEEEKQLTAEGFEVPPWAPDDSSTVCLGCSAKFTTTNRRHHCRNCGQLFCKKCTQKKCFLPKFGFTQKKMRVCEKCFLKH